MKDKEIYVFKQEQEHFKLVDLFCLKNVNNYEGIFDLGIIIHTRLDRPKGLLSPFAGNPNRC